MRILFVLLSLFIVYGGWCQLTSLEVLQKIESMQIRSDEFYDPGLFPVHRTWNLSKEPVEDNTIFFTAAIIHTLNDLYPSMDLESRILVNSLKKKAIENYSKYQSRNNEPTYNFWQTIDPDLPFPHGNKWVSNPKMRLPDDLDTSVLLAMSSEDKDIKSKLREKMVAYAARENRGESLLNTLEKYEHLHAYEAWFARDMPQTFDICVMANAMHFVLSEDYVLNRYDSATIDLIKRMILDEDHVDHVDAVSHHTTSAALILYHVARLIQVDREGIFDAIKPKVVKDLIAELSTTESEMEKMLAQTALIKLEGFPQGGINHQKLEKELEEFVFFSVKPFLGNPQLAFLNSVVPDISWKCEAYNWTLYLEYLQLNQTYLTNLSGSR